MADKEIDEKAFQTFHPGRQTLNHQNVAVPIDDEAGKKITLPVRHSVGVRYPLQPLLSHPGGSEDSISKKRNPYLLPMRGQKTKNDLRLGIEMTHPQKLPLRRIGFADLPGRNLSVDPFNSPGKNPRVSP